MSSFKVNRRTLFKGAVGASGLALGARVGGPFVPLASAQAAEKPALLVVYLAGGYNALFGSADSFSAAGTFGVTAQNQLNVGNGLIVDSVFNVLPEVARAKMATIGVNHGIANHGGAQVANFTQGGQNAALVLAAGMGGSAAIKAANAGQQVTPGPTGAVSGVSLQAITDMQATLDALGAGGADANEPKREAVAAGLVAAGEMSAGQLAKNKKTLESVDQSFSAAVETLRKPPEVFNVQEFSTAYTLGTSLAVRDFKSKIAAAELMMRAGTNVVTVRDDGWDTHGDTRGATVRQKMSGTILPPLVTFANRMMAAQGRNVVIAILGDFARSLPGSDHASALSATVMGKYVRAGTTGKMTPQVGLTAGSPGIAGFWGYLAAVLKAPAATVSAFGGNPHTTVSMG